MLKGKATVVTGAARGMGREICLKMAGYGASIVALDLDEENAKKTAADIVSMGGKAFGMKVDVANKEMVDAAFAAAVKEFGHVDILSNNVGICIPVLMTEVTEAQWDKSFAINCKGTMLTCQTAAKIMKEQNYGRIIVTASQYCKVDGYANGPYCISRAGVSMMMQVMAIELSGYNVLVNSISPGYTVPPIFSNGVGDRVVRDGRHAKEIADELMGTVPIGCVTKTDEIAELVCFLGSEENSCITGTNVIIAGGNIIY